MMPIGTNRLIPDNHADRYVFSRIDHVLETSHDEACPDMI